MSEEQKLDGAGLLEAVGAAATMTGALAAMLAETFDRPDIARDFTKLLHKMQQSPDQHPATRMMYRMCAETLARYG